MNAWRFRVMSFSSPLDVNELVSVPKKNELENEHLGKQIIALSLPLTKEDSLELVNQLLLKVNCSDRLGEQYLSVILNNLSPIDPPVEIGLSDVSQFESIVCFNPVKMPLETLWHFISEQVELISSFRLMDGKIVLSNNNRRMGGTYETPVVLADALADMVVTDYLRVNTKPKEHPSMNGGDGDLKEISILDPACGTGRLLFSIMNKIERLAIDYSESVNVKTAFRKDFIANNIHGVDKDPVAVIATRFLFWYSSLDQNGGCVPDIKVGDSLMGQTFDHKRTSSQSKLNPTNSPDDFNWKKEYPSFTGFDIIIMNPPWEKVKMMTRETLEDTVLGSLSSRAEIDRALEMGGNGHIKKIIEEKRKASAEQASYFRNCGDFPYSSRGDLNLYALFTERCNSLLGVNGTAGLIVPTGIATDFHLKALFSSLVNEERVIEFHDFINKKKLFQNVDSRYRYSYLIFSKNPTTSSIRTSYYNLTPESINEASFLLTKKQIQSLNPMTNTLIIPKTPSVIPILTKIHEDMPLLSSNNKNDGSWNVRYKRQADMTNDSYLFVPTQDMIFDSKNRGVLIKDNQEFLRVYEGKMVDRYNHRAGSTINKEGQYRRSGQAIRPTIAELMNKKFLAKSRYAISRSDIDKNPRLSGNLKPWHLVFKDITAATNRRTLRAAIIPSCVVSNKLPTLEVNDVKKEACLLAILNSAMLDYICRQKIGNITLNWYILRQLPIPPMSMLHEGVIDGIKIEDWLIERVRQLTYVSCDLEEWNRAVGGSPQIFPWDESSRIRTEAEIDALMFHLYHVSKKEATEILKEFPQLDHKMIMDIYSKMGINIP